MRGEQRVGDLLAARREPQSSVSNHLACLRWCGYVASRREGKFVYDRAAGPRVRELHPDALRGVDQFGAGATTLLVAPFLIIPYTSDATWLWLGASVLLAAARGYAGCEVLAISNWLLRRDDTVGCLVFTPIDLAEKGARDGGPANSAERLRHDREWLAR
jgi:hypothetical protein